MPDADIDYTEIPEWTEENFRSAVRGGHQTKKRYNVILYLDDYAWSWLATNASQQASLTIHALKQVVQHGRRAVYEREKGSQRSIYDTLSDTFRHGLDLLAGRCSPEEKYVDLPEYSDVELKVFGLEPGLALLPHAIGLLLDEEVGSWLEQNASEYRLRLNYAISFVARRMERATGTELGKAS